MKTSDLLKAKVAYDRLIGRRTTVTVKKVAGNARNRRKAYRATVQQNPKPEVSIERIMYAGGFIRWLLRGKSRHLTDLSSYHNFHANLLADFTQSTGFPPGSLRKPIPIRTKHE